MKKLSLVMVFLLFAAATYAGGYRVSTQGQRALAMGHAGVAVVNSAELAFFNPAGLVFLENKLNISAGMTGVISNVKYQNEMTGAFAKTDSSLGTPFYLYASYSISEKLALGLSIYTPYGSSVEWPTDWSGSHLVNNIDLQAIYIQPLISYKITDNLSVGGGPIFVTGSVNFNRNLNRTLTNEEGKRSNVEIDASGVTNFGWSVSAMFSPIDSLRIGVNYRSEIILKAEDGDATFSNVPNSPLAPVSNGTVAFNAELPLPAELAIGASYEFDKWLFAFDYNRTFWSVYESLDIDFIPDDIPDSINPRNYKDSSTYRFGVQYKALDNLALRLGYYYDQSPVQSGYFAPETPRNDSQGYTGGFSFDITPKIAIDASFVYLRFKQVNESYDHYQENGQEVSFRGTYKSNAFLPGLGVTLKL
ncbi:MULTISPECIES: OmpP1/FadL family transporter [Mesonia]|mgnify:CR=1 FL=1|uniref:Outer membrane protein n=1 Tax=Mesonia oceanica TaxID=2687242 RepID=A0AC61YBL1_9FLAO|nr:MULTISPECIES: outer membrane protein transport protein [Mesonia]MAN27387.1 transporter [Mesonia sp.]MBJ97249.1 transporter [Flavobacteriaceae bacterium]VVV00770.1 Putative outer membrane protein [Mesonia oceanica]|tara:strand:+ start:77 stop:1330 length:1254 start_codon:yes stop_codon:yes gene_type:complete